MRRSVFRDSERCREGAQGQGERCSETPSAGAMRLKREIFENYFGRAKRSQNGRWGKVLRVAKRMPRRCCAGRGSGARE
jgi:hypothetical protein